MVRMGKGLKSEEAAERLSTGAIIEEVELAGERLHYKLVSGTGPEDGWISLKAKGTELVVEVEESGAPGDEPVAVDEDYKKKLEEAAKKREADGDLLNYCTKFKMLGFPLDKPKMRILCFHNAGSTESTFTSAGTDFLKWIKESKEVELIAMSYPGRDRLNKAKKHTSIDTLCQDLMEICYPKLADGVPYCTWSHSMGTWVCFEFLMLARKAGLPMPTLGLFNAFPAPHMPTKMRKWRKNRHLNDEQMRQELLNWDKGHFTGPGKVVFDNPGWKETWEPMMRADFTVFDEYVFKHNNVAKFDFPIYAWHFENEYFNKPEQIEMWKDWTTGEFHNEIMKDMGHLTCVYNDRKKYMEKATEVLKGALP